MPPKASPAAATDSDSAPGTSTYGQEADVGADPGPQTALPPHTAPEVADALRGLWRETPDGFIAKLPRGTGPKEARSKGKCNVCDGYHELPAIHLDYCGHSDTTRLVADTDPFWQWEPIAGWDPETGEPRFVRDNHGNPRRLWIWLTVLGVRRPGVGSVDAGKNDPEKELIGDAIRNAAQRFGVAADLWSKARGGGHDDPDVGSGGTMQRPQAQPEPVDPAVQAIIDQWPSRDDFDSAHEDYAQALGQLDDDDRKATVEWKRGTGMGWPLPPEMIEVLRAFMRNGCPPTWTIEQAREAAGLAVNDLGAVDPQAEPATTP